jgi:hypothetical protein
MKIKVFLPWCFSQSFLWWHRQLEFCIFVHNSWPNKYQQIIKAFNTHSEIVDKFSSIIS